MLSFTQQVRQWAASKPADEKYDYGSNDNCGLCQFLRAAGCAEYPRAGGDYWRRALPDGGIDGPDIKIDERLKTALVCGPRTFGALADRLSK